MGKFKKLKSITEIDTKKYPREVRSFPVKEYGCDEPICLLEYVGLTLPRIIIDHDRDNNYCSVSGTVYADREENDTEWLKRVNEMLYLKHKAQIEKQHKSKLKANKEERELKELARLKAKYEI